MVILNEPNTDISRREMLVFLKTVTHPGVAQVPMSESIYQSPRECGYLGSSSKRKLCINCTPQRLEPGETRSIKSYVLATSRSCTSVRSVFFVGLIKSHTVKPQATLS